MRKNHNRKRTAQNKEKQSYFRSRLSLSIFTAQIHLNAHKFWWARRFSVGLSVLFAQRSNSKFWFWLWLGSLLFSLILFCPSLWLLFLFYFQFFYSVSFSVFIPAMELPSTVARDAYCCCIALFNFRKTQCLRWLVVFFTCNDDD